jgi:hypothetical protein
MRSLAIVVLLMLLAVVGLWYFGGPYAQRTLHAKLQKMVSDQLNATLEMGAIEYEYPFGVTVDDVSLVTSYDDKPITLASFDRLRLQLTRLPFGEEPLQIERIDIDSPTLHLIQTQRGFVGQGQLLRSDEERSKRAAPPLSEIFHLRHLSVTDAEAIYEDHRKPDQTPLVWRDINMTVDTQPRGASHAFDFNGNSGRAATVAGKGVLDLDTLMVDLESMTIRTEITPDASESPLPPEITEELARYKVSGTAEVNISGRGAVNNLRAGNLTVALKVENATAVHPDFPDPLQDLDLNASATYADGSVNLNMDLLAARSGSMGISASQFNVLVDLETLSWTASPIRVAVAYAPTDITRSFLDQPATLFVVARATPLEGGGTATIDLSGSSLTLPNLNDELKLQSTIEVRPDSILLNPSVVTGLGGRVSLDGWHHIPTEASAANVGIENVSLASLKTLLKPTADREMQGRLNAGLTARLTGTDLSTFTAYGRARVTEGTFARVPVLSSIASFLRVGRGMFVAQSAYARFGIENQVITFNRIAASTDALRVRGEGTLTFDEKLDLRLYIIGSGDWGKSVKGTGIPIISDVGGALAGGAQGLIRGVTTQFTTVRVRGTLDDPKVTPDPAPMITDQVKKLFESE